MHSALTVSGIFVLIPSNKGIEHVRGETRNENTSSEETVSKQLRNVWKCLMILDRKQVLNGVA